MDIGEVVVDYVPPASHERLGRKARCQQNGHCTAAQNSLLYALFATKPGRGHQVAKPNYAFAKRQRDLAKKQRKEEKRRRKLEPEDPASVKSVPDLPPAEKATS